MKNRLKLKQVLILTVISFLIIMSCKTGEEKKNNLQVESSKQEPPIETESKPYLPLDLKAFSEKFEGVWLPKEYLLDIKKSKSAYESRKAIPQIAELTIHRKDLKNDTLFVGSSINNHEGYGFNIWESGQQKDQEFLNNIFEWEDKKQYHFAYNQADTTISIIIKNCNNEIENKIDFIKVLGKEFASNYGGVGYEYISRKSIINGEYHILDSAQNDLGLANFEPMRGQIENFKFGHYTIMTDYIANPCYPSDHLLLRLEPEEFSNQEYLTIINRNDTILLFDSEEIITESSYDFKLRDIKYYMIEKNY